jgi:hypothetical protein
MNTPQLAARAHRRSFTNNGNEYKKKIKIKKSWRMPGSGKQAPIP